MACKNFTHVNTSSTEESGEFMELQNTLSKVEVECLRGKALYDELCVILQKKAAESKSSVSLETSQNKKVTTKTSKTSLVKKTSSGDIGVVNPVVANVHSKIQRFRSYSEVVQSLKKENKLRSRFANKFVK